MFTTPASRVTVADQSADQLQFSISHLVSDAPLFLCSWYRDLDAAGQEPGYGAFLCDNKELHRFLLAVDLPKIVAIQVLIRSSEKNWSLRNAFTVAHRINGRSEFGELAFSDDVELFDSWAKRLPDSAALIPLWSAPRDVGR